MQSIILVSLNFRDWHALFWGANVNPKEDLIAGNHLNEKGNIDYANSQNVFYILMISYI